MSLTRENKLDAWSGLAAIAGVALTVAASELGAPALLGIGVGVVIITTIARVANVRGKLHERGKSDREHSVTNSHP